MARDIEKANELNELIELAEKTCDRINSLKSGKSNYLTLIGIFTTGLLLFLFIEMTWFRLSSFDLKISITSLALLIFGIIVGSNTFYYIKVTQDIFVEERILAQLLDMIQGQKELLFSEDVFTIIERAIIEMRLSRIDFSILDKSKAKETKVESSIELKGVLSHSTPSFSK